MDRSGLTVEITGSRENTGVSAPATGGPEWAFRILIAVCWVLSLTCWSVPGRGGPLSIGAIDWIALMKLGARFFSIALIGWVLLRLHAAPGVRQVISRLTPFAIFALWTLASVYWSPLKAVTAGHGLDVVLLVMLAAAAGVLANSEDRLRRLFLNLFLTMFAVSLALLVLNHDNILSDQRPSGYMQPNEMATIAGTGLTLLITCRLLWRWDWTRKLFLPGVAVCGLALFAARSRTAIFVTLIVLAGLGWVFRRPFLLISVLALAGLIAALAPYVDTITRLPDQVSAYLTRGESREELITLTGRDELWAEALRAFRESPLFGHGYYMISSSGSMHVWRKEQYQTAHSLPLHILTGTGLIGALFFCWGFWAALGLTFKRLASFATIRRIDLLVLVIVTWFLIAGLFEISFLGPIEPAVVLFFSIVGVALRFSSPLAPIRVRPPEPNRFASVAGPLPRGAIRSGS